MSMEQEEAKRAMDGLAREVHGIYGQHAAEAGLKTPKWEELPEPAKGISRDISRLVLVKMHEAYNEGVKLGQAEKAVTGAEKAVDAIEKSTVAIPLPRSWGAKEALEFVSGAKPHLEELLDKAFAAKRASPIGKGLDAAISRLTEKMAVDVFAEDPELMAKLRRIVETELARFLLSDPENAED